MMALTDAECARGVQLQAAVLLQAGGVIFLWTLFVASLYGICLQSLVEGAPALAAQFFAVSGLLQLVAVGAVLAVFWPRCPAVDECAAYCSHNGGGSGGGTLGDWWEFYAGFATLAVEALVGALWLRAAYRRSRLAGHLTREYGSGGPDGAIFTKIPAGEVQVGGEMELTEHSEEEDDGPTHDA